MINNDEKCLDFTARELEVLRKIKIIVAKGNDAEVRIDKNGQLKVYEIKKRIA